MAPAAGQARRPRENGGGQPPVFCGHALDCALGRAVARSSERLWPLEYRLSTFRALADVGVWNRVFDALAEEADFEEVFFDSTAIRVHQHAASLDLMQQMARQVLDSQRETREDIRENNEIKARLGRLQSEVARLHVICSVSTPSGVTHHRRSCLLPMKAPQAIRQRCSTGHPLLERSC